MAEPSLEGYGDRADLRRALAVEIAAVRSDLRLVAEGFLGEESVMDGLAVGSEGELVSIRFAKPADDRATLTRALADLTWLRARRKDWLKLAPGLGIDPSVEPRAMVFCRSFSVESRAAVDNLPDHTVELWQCRGIDLAGQRRLLIEPVDARPASPTRRPGPVEAAVAPRCPETPRPPETRASTPSAPASGPRPDRPVAPAAAERPDHTRIARRLADPPSGSTFRTGLRPADLTPAHAGPAPTPARPHADPAIPVDAPPLRGHRTEAG
ncbi:MAG: hypothetical protein R3F35_13925 [Myxococcota bacterium]